MATTISKQKNSPNCITPRIFRNFAHSMILASIVVIAGCNKNSPPSSENSPAQNANTTTATAAANKMTSNIAVKGDEALPPNHPPLSAAPHAATNSMDTARNQQIASQHPKSSAKKELSVIVPESVKREWASATLTVSTGKSEKEIKLPIGGKISLENKLQLHLLHYLPAYTSDSQSVTSSSDKQDNPAVQIQAIADGRVIAEGWIFQNLPEFNSFHSEQVKVRLISAERTRK